MRVRPPICRQQQLPTRIGPGNASTSTHPAWRRRAVPCLHDSGALATVSIDCLAWFWLASSSRNYFCPHKTKAPPRIRTASPPSVSRFDPAAAPPLPSFLAEMDGSSLKCAQLLEQMRLHLATDAGKELIKKVGLVYQLNIAPKKLGVDEEIFVVDLKKGEVTKGPYEGKPDATFSFTDNDFLAIATGKTNPQMAFIRGAIKIKGSISAAQKFTPDIFPKPAKL